MWSRTYSGFLTNKRCCILHSLADKCVQQENEHGDAPVSLHEIDAGRSQNSDGFSTRYGLTSEMVQFDLDCAACCWEFLTKQ